MHRWLAPNVIIPVSERLTGRRAWSEMRLLQSLQWRSAAELEARAFAKLGPLLTQAAAHVPYYRDLCSGSDVHPSDIRCLDDLAKVPVTTKDALRANFPARVVADNLPRSRFVERSTSGSTGSPFRFYADADADTARHASYLFFLDWTGAALRDKRFVIAYQGYVPLDPMAVRLARRVLLGEQAILLSGVDLTAAAFRSRVGRLRGRSRYFIQAYPSYAALLATSILEQGVDLGVYPIAVITMSETLTDLHADIISRAFRCRVVNHYSTWESLHLAQTCPDNPQLLHVNSEKAILRVVREDGSPAAVGEEGRVFLTDLANYVMPFINYDIGDRAVVGPPCPCGRGFPTLQRIEGRAGEIIRTPDGRSIATAALTRRLGRLLLDRVWSYQAAQTAPDAVVLRVMPTARFTPEFSSALQGDLQEFLGPTVDVTIEIVEQIPVEASGKRLIVKPLPGAYPPSGPATPAAG